MVTTNTRRKLRALLNSREISIAPGCYDGITGMLVEQAGFPIAYMSGLCVAATLGEPDVGSISVDVMVERARTIASAISIPLIVDADSGYGGAYNVHCATRALEASGAAALHLEDQPFPKKCAAMAGKELVPVAEMVARLRVALDARTDPDFVIIARTDAFAVEGLDAAIARLQAYEDAGADATILMSVATEDDMRKITSSLRKPTIVMMVEGLRPLVSAERLQEIGYPVVCYPVSLLQAQAFSQKQMLEGLRAQGSTTASLNQTMVLPELSAFMGQAKANAIDGAFSQYLLQAQGQESAA
ncbi:isocitrate lyase/PEP mutase family protein [Variovorax sp. ZT5P49]|uniref:isocitrate lyase/PEP mutase family protein n=1 Tax=Variovorax sp. ZT5P49 TaxID=3443733 RepID=UPI003F47F07D